MGFVRAPRMFHEDYGGCIDEWMTAVRMDFSEQRTFIRRCPHDGGLVDTSTTVHVDDVSRQFVCYDHARLEAQHIEASQLLADKLSVKGYTLDLGKSIAVVPFRGLGSYLQMREAQGRKRMTGQDESEVRFLALVARGRGGVRRGIFSGSRHARRLAVLRRHSGRQGTISSTSHGFLGPHRRRVGQRHGSVRVDR